MSLSVGIIGGGASGMAAAIAAAEQGAKVTILEKNDRLGKKILATGNGKCNLGNENLSGVQYYSEDISLVDTFLQKHSTEETKEFFRGLGLMIKDKNGYLYPYSEQAASVLDVLRFRLQQLGINMVTDCTVNKIHAGRKQYMVDTAKGTYSFDRIILCTGGKAAPKTGSDGSGYKMTESLGMKLYPIVPALVQLKCKENWFKSVSGVRAEADVQILSKGKVVAAEKGEVQLTDYGISGIPVFQVSRVVNRMLLDCKEVNVRLKFLPYDKQEFAQKMYEERKGLLQGRTAEEYFSGLLNKKLMLLFMKLAGISAADPVSKVNKVSILRVYEFCCEITVTVIGHNGFENAQVCAGGVALTEVDEDLQSLKYPGLYLAGELLDVDGKCGGYNLHWAWCSGKVAGYAAAKEK